ncbi:MAG: helix-turn-helix domain-containing protein [Ginsengibacter sp.]
MERTFRKSMEEVYPQKIFANQLITVDDLLQFKKQLLEELLTALKSQINTVQKKWMKSHEVRRLLKISPGTLQTLKSSGIIPYTKIGGVHFYDYHDIEKVLQSGKVNGNYKGD